jgi:hypothetical protein
MKDDHTFDGVPVSSISTSDLARLVHKGISITNMSGFPGTRTQAKEAVMKRLQIELTIRLYNMRGS